jgi:UDP-N-acetylmuramyl tripeptide synthase
MLGVRMGEFKEYVLGVEEILINSILPDKDNMETAVDSLSKGMYSMDHKPIKVSRVGGKYVVLDGHHRLLQAILDGKDTIRAQVEDGGKYIGVSGTIELDSSSAGRFYGLDELLENGWLLNRL